MFRPTLPQQPIGTRYLIYYVFCMTAARYWRTSQNCLNVIGGWCSRTWEKAESFALLRFDWVSELATRDYYIGYGVYHVS